MADIFLSYSRDDEAETDRLATILKRLGWSVWWDTDLNAGEQWPSTIKNEANNAGCIVVLWSKSSVLKEWVLNEATIGLERGRLVPMILNVGLVPPTKFGPWHAGSLATWDGTFWHPEFQKLVRALKTHLGDSPMSIPPCPPYPLYARQILQKDRPGSVAELSLPRNGEYFPSPPVWSDEVLYLLIPDRFSDGREAERKLLDRSTMLRGEPASAEAAPPDRWLASGRERWQGGTLSGVTSKLGYLQGLGVTTVWLWPVFKQRSVANTYHGYAPQDFLDVDPNFGTREDLVMLVAQAHGRKMRVILSGELHHSGMNWIYGDDAGNPITPRYTAERYAFGAWLDANDLPVWKPENRDDAVWPRELQDPECYLRAGSGQLGPGERDEEDPDAEFKRSDFFSLRRFNPARALQSIIDCHRYWLALTDCDGLFIDCAAHEPRSVLNTFCGAIREYAARLGKQNFLVIGEVFGTMQQLEMHYGLIGRTLHGSLNAILDNGPMRLKLHEVAKGRAPAWEWFAGYGESAGEMGVQRTLGSKHVSILDDPDGVFGPKLRFAFDAKESQIVVALAIQLFSLGIPCIYYGTEQALGQRPLNWPNMPPTWGMDDACLREAMFGPEHPCQKFPQHRKSPLPIDETLPGFGPLGVAGRHVFDEASILYQLIAALTALRRSNATLRTGRQYQREIALHDGVFEFPPAGQLVAWSRILGDEEILCVVNPNVTATKAGRVVVDSSLNPEGATMGVIFATGATDPGMAGEYSAGTEIQVLWHGGTAYVDLSGIPPNGVLVMSNRAGVNSCRLDKKKGYFSRR